MYLYSLFSMRTDVWAASLASQYAGFASHANLLPIMQVFTSGASLC